MTDDPTPGQQAHTAIAHAVRLWYQAELLRQQALAHLADATDLAWALDDDEHQHLADRIRQASLTPRAAFTRFGTLRVPQDYSTGNVVTKQRGDRKMWPPQGRYVVYKLYDTTDTLLYIGMSGNLGQRITGHAGKPWENVQIVPCADAEHALDLEAELIYRHQPPLNRIGKARR